MPYVNLIQEQRLAAQANDIKTRSFFLAFVGVLIVSGIAYGFLSMETMLVSHKASEIEAQNKKNAPIVAEITKNQNDLGDLSPRLKTLEDAQTNTDRWNRILSHLAVQTPAAAWLTGLRCQASDATKPIQVTFVGVAPTQSTIGEFTMRLQNEPDLDNVQFKSSSEKLIVNSKATEFQIDSDLAGTAEQKVKSEEDDKK